MQWFDKLRVLRYNKEPFLTRFAKGAGLKAQTYRRIEEGETARPGDETLQKVFDGLGLCEDERLKFLNEIEASCTI